jgi:PAS domain S-box-containing protein
LIPPDRLTEEDFILGRIRNGESVEHFETRRLTKEGRPIDVSVTASPIRDAAGTVIGASKVARDITERKRTEDALQMSEHLFRAAFENAMVGVALVGLDGRFLGVNRTLCEKVGYSAAELKEKTFHDITHEDDRHIGADLLAKVQAGELKGARFEKRYRHKDGRIVWVHISAVLLDMEHGGRQQFISYIRDITKEKEDSRRIRHLNRVYAVLSGINETIVRERDLTAMLQAACHIAVGRGEFRMAWIGLLDESTQVIKPAAYAGVEEGYAGLANIDMRDPVRAKGPGGQALLNGRHVVCNDIEHDRTYGPWRDEALRRGYRSSVGLPLKVRGKVMGLFSLYAGETDFFNLEELQLLDELAMDIGFAMEVDSRETLRRQAEESLRQSEKRFSTIFQSSPVPISLINLSSSRFVDANECFFRMSGFTREETIGRTALELNIYPDPSRRAVILDQLQQHGYLHAHEQLFRTKSGQIRNHLLWIEPMAPGDDKLLLVIALDLTEQKQAEQQQKLLEEQLRQAQKLEALGTLAGGIAHDFNNILGAIISFSELSRMDHPHDAELQENLGQVLKASDRATSLVRQILSFSRQQKHERRNLQLAPVVKEALQLLRATLPSTIEMQQSIAPDLPGVLANPTQIHQVVMNLCTNAGHAMKNAPGRLVVSLDLLDLKNSGPRPHVALHAADYVRLTIGDTGHGMDEATLKRIYEPFFTTKGPGEGTGLGLSVVHGIIKEHDGIIDVASTLGKGTTFTIYFPARATAAGSESSGTTDFPTGNGEQIFFVDDESALGEVAKKMLLRLGYRPVVFSHPQPALEAILQKPDACDLLISDFTMPAMTGLELARQFRQVRPGLPVLLASGNGGALTTVEMQAAGVGELITKPFDYQTLARSLARALRQKAPAKNA